MGAGTGSDTLRQQLPGHGKGFAVARGHQRGSWATRFQLSSLAGLSVARAFAAGASLEHLGACSHVVRQWPDGVWPPCHTGTCWLLWAPHANPRRGGRLRTPRMRWEGRRAGSTEPCPAGALPALPLPRRVRAGRWLGAWTGRAGALTSRRGEAAWGQPVWLDSLPSSAHAPLPAVDRNQAEAEQGPPLGCLWWTAGEEKECRRPRRKSQPLYLTGKASLHSANASLVMCWLQRP